MIDTSQIAVPAGLPRIGDPPPDFEADSTHGRVRLADYAGRWLVLFSHPAEFTPVCTTEFGEGDELVDDFAACNTALLGNSIDSVFSHPAWTRAIADKLGVRIPFPIIADLDMRVARAYGMLHPNTSQTAAVRAVFVIDPEQTVRAVLYHPMNAGRMMPEILRLIDALQTSDRDSVSCPANWRPGDDVVLGAPRTEAALDARLADHDVKLTDWYLATQSDRGAER
ncbi:peroxiredoxin [Actinoplanes awajinensis]|uniref:Peroxiredoxin n=1 Tax=Actinoplanes awajinensis subsp. mycoplanecinus TaxID=135947 RepID=A0A101JHG8_9ACTN|nr:peroxiredoxin [Actinoplanes awajinensis]KUL26914.1 peroxiredoxin [Actinoplanes awajinensis subsp. mycoplanecinus]